MNKLCLTIEESYQNNLDILLSCHQALKEQYPQLKFRWARIYGRRWSYIHGSAADDIGLNLAKIKLNDKYGLCIENSTDIDLTELDQIITILKEYFTNEQYFNSGTYQTPKK